MPTFNLHITFLNEKNKMLQDVKKHSVRHTSLTFTRVKLCKRDEVNSESFHLWYGVFSVGGMQLPVS